MKQDKQIHPSSSPLTLFEIEFDAMARVDLELLSIKVEMELERRRRASI